MDSLVVDPVDARVQFVDMAVERMNTVEDKVEALAAQLAKVEADNASMQAALAAAPRPQGHYFHLRVPRGTTRQQVEEGLKAAWASQQLSTDGVCRTGFCVSMTKVFDIATGDRCGKDASVFVFGASGVMPYQAGAWVTAAVPGGKLSREYGTWRMMFSDAEVEYFMQKLCLQDTWVMYPGRQDWVREAMEPLCDGDECDVDAWMEQTYVHGLPWVALDGGEVQVHVARRSA